MTPDYPHIRYTGSLAIAFPRATSPESEFLGSIWMPKDTAPNRRRAEQELRRMFPARK